VLGRRSERGFCIGNLGGGAGFQLGYRAPGGIANTVAGELLAEWVVLEFISNASWAKPRQSNKRDWKGYWTAACTDSVWRASEAVEVLSNHA
jgi:hypothetical protein